VAEVSRGSAVEHAPTDDIAIVVVHVKGFRTATPVGS
jgi:hypothetical protein